MILIGSHALETYIDLDRKKHDWDFLMTTYELDVFNETYKKYWVKTTEYSHVYDINGDIVEIRNNKNLDDTDWDLLCVTHDQKKETPYGIAYVPSIQLLYDIKKSTALCIPEPKHGYDLDKIQFWFVVQDNSPFFLKRLEETQARTKKQTEIKYNFFHKYLIPEYILHDRLHDMYAELLEISIPTYKRITVAETDISKELFDNLTHQQKINLMVEESLVLALERWFIPQNVEHGINYRLIDKFFNNNEAMPTYSVLKHVCITGLIGESAYITEFSKEHFFEIELAWIAAKDKIKQQGGFPGWFFQEIFELRKRYRNNEKVAIL